MTKKTTQPIQRDWLSKTLAGVLLGAVIALVCSGWFTQLNSEMPFAIRGQLAMWMVPPIWLGVLSGTYFFGSGARAWLWLGAASVLSGGSLAVLRLA